MEGASFSSLAFFLTIFAFMPLRMWMGTWMKTRMSTRERERGDARAHHDVDGETFGDFARVHPSAFSFLA